MSDVIDWLLDGAPGAQRPPDVLDQLCRRLIASGFPLDRAAVFVHVLHPQYVAYSTHWLPDRPIEVRPAPYELATEDGFLRSPATLVMSRGESLRRDLTAPQAADDLPLLARLRAEGFTDYLIQPIRFTNGEVQAVSWATRRAGGFSDQDVARLAAINRPFARVIEIRSLHRLCTTLLDTYVGHGSGERVLKGAIRPGDVQRIEAAILVSDMRGFTAFSNAHPPEQVIERLNAVFGCIMPAVDAEGGEVLKLIGDGLLAIFPLAEREPGAVCAAALRAAETATRAVAALDLDAAGPLRHGPARGRSQLRQYRRRQPARLHRHRAGRQPRRPDRAPERAAGARPARLRHLRRARRCRAGALGHLFAARLSRAHGGLRAGGMNQVNHVKVRQEEEGWRFDRWAKTHYPTLAFGQLQKLCRTGQFRLDGKRVEANERLAPGQLVRVPPLGDLPAAPPKAGKRQVRPEDAALIRSLIVYQDERLIALNKPAGLAVQGGSGTTRHIDGLLDALVKKGERPKLVHRLDRDTSGLMVVAKSAAAARELAFAFQQHKVRKLYWAILLKGPERNTGLIDLPLAKAGPGRPGEDAPPRP